MTWLGTSLSIIKGPREFKLPWNSGLNKVYRLVITWGYAVRQAA